MPSRTSKWVKRSSLFGSMGLPYHEKSKWFTNWAKLFLQATDFDRWNEKEKAVETYER